VGKLASRHFRDKLRKKAVERFALKTSADGLSAYADFLEVLRH
jgi:hypothetical protein